MTMTGNCFPTIGTKSGNIRTGSNSLLLNCMFGPTAVSYVVRATKLTAAHELQFLDVGNPPG